MLPLALAISLSTCIAGCLGKYGKWPIIVGAVLSVVSMVLSVASLIVYSVWDWIGQLLSDKGGYIPIFNYEGELEVVQLNLYFGPAVGIISVFILVCALTTISFTIAAVCMHPECIKLKKTVRKQG